MNPTLLDLYAAAALQGILACPREFHADIPIAERAFNLAEQMLRERAKRTGMAGGPFAHDPDDAPDVDDDDVPF